MDNATDTLPEDSALTDGTEFYQVRVYARGVRKRCRKSEFKGFKMANVLLSVKDKPAALEKLKDAARLRLDNEMKTVEKSYLDFTYTKISGEFLESYPYNEKNFKVEL